ncbi:type VI secretion system baseplate subunit TssE [Defluviimonas sp. WL0024]|uniref:Type VI secretion system baseplate subunit TssE n=1 Tax=Albidovulum salinarum TaxID=2984153 RepID=A0ABT2X7F6_9RHOB|nr:type VI secretion system baseplate subunit TssE [Defluviimonas sp. WL0024]MCU9849887.1 type VI secretion system baseplate subunit TssE [Defluviimonas sp. WL0024]
MADKTVAERLQPSLLDRLTDDEPGSLKETRDSRVIDVVRLREIIQRDLAWLLNTNNMEDVLDIDTMPRVRRSVLNYGLRPTSGDYSTAEKAERIRRSIARAIEAFEPRIIAGSAIVELRTEKNAGEMHIAFDIRADMWAQPMPLELYLRSKVDVTTGEVEMERAR